MQPKRKFTKLKLVNRLNSVNDYFITQINQNLLANFKPEIHRLPA